MAHNPRNTHPSWASRFIRKERLRQNITQEEMSRRTGVRVGNIRNIEWQCNSPRFETMEKLINMLGYELQAIKSNDSNKALKYDLQCQSIRFEKIKRETYEILDTLEKRAKRLGMSLQQACEEAGVAYSTVTRWRTGFSSPTLKSISKINSALNDVENDHEYDEQIQWLEQLSKGQHNA
jgi:transcriptional regulator with XRE-family HTH domain